MGSSKALHSKRYQVFFSRPRRAREESGMTQMEVAKAMKRSQTWVSKSELGERRVDFVELEGFARAYGRPLDYFRTN